MSNAVDFKASISIMLLCPENDRFMKRLETQLWTLSLFLGQNINFFYFTKAMREFWRWSSSPYGIWTIFYTQKFTANINFPIKNILFLFTNNSKEGNHEKNSPEQAKNQISTRPLNHTAYEFLITFLTKE